LRSLILLTPILFLGARIEAQQPIIYEGARVRITWTEPADWLHGTIATPSSRELGIQADEADEDTRIVLDERTRLQIHRGRVSNVVPGLVIGGVVGAALVTAFFSGDFGNEGTFFATSQAAFTGGLTGVAVGTVISYFGLGEDVWEEVDVLNGRVVFPPLESPPSSLRNASVRARILWDRFIPKEPSFISFFQEHRRNLSPIEGLFVRKEGFGRFAIVRDSMFAELRYVMINLEPPTTQSQYEFGQIMGGLNLDPITNEYEVRYVDDSNRSPSKMTINGDELVVEQKNGQISRWEKRSPVSEEGAEPKTALPLTQRSKEN
jgi:hypothetical protein